MSWFKNSKINHKSGVTHCVSGKFATYYKNNNKILSRKKKRTPPLLNIKIESYAAEGKSIVRLEDGKVLFVDNAIPGDIIDVIIIKDKKSWAQGKTIRLVEPSPQRIEPFCQHFGVCGGCKWQMLPYPQQLIYKQQQ